MTMHDSGARPDKRVARSRIAATIDEQVCPPLTDKPEHKDIVEVRWGGIVTCCRRQIAKDALGTMPERERRLSPPVEREHLLCGQA
jgi:hypothetical protein